MLEKTNCDTSHAISRCPSNHIKNKEQEKQVLPTNTGSDLFTSQEPLSNLAETDGKISGSFCTKVDPTIFNMLNIFSPFVNLIMGLSPLESKKEASKEEIIQNLGNILKSIQTNIESNKDLNGKLSKRANEALDRLYKSVSLIQSDKKLGDMDIAELIAHWKENKNHKALLEMAERIRRGECSHISNRDLRRGLIEGLESFADSLEEASGHPKSRARDEVIEALNQGAGRIVDNVEVIENKRGDENLSEDERETISENFEIAKEKIDETINDPEKSRFISRTKTKLESWGSYIEYFINTWAREDKEEEDRDKHKKEAEICQFRHKKEKEILDLKRRMNLKRKLVSKFHFIQNKIQLKIDKLIALLKYGKKKNYSQAIEELRTYRKRESRVDSKYFDLVKSESDSENKYKLSNFELEISNILDGTVDCHC